MARKLPKPRTQSVRQRTSAAVRASSERDGNTIPAWIVQSDGSMIARDPNARIVRIGKGAGFFKRAYYITKESLLHPRTTSYLVSENDEVVR